MHGKELYRFTALTTYEERDIGGSGNDRATCIAEIDYSVLTAFRSSNFEQYANVIGGFMRRRADYCERKETKVE